MIINHDYMIIMRHGKRLLRASEPVSNDITPPLYESGKGFSSGMLGICLLLASLVLIASCNHLIPNFNH